MMIALQLVAAVSAFVGMWLIGNKNQQGLAIGLVGDACILAINIGAELWILAAVTVVFSVLRARAWVKWTVDKPPKGD